MENGKWKMKNEKWKMGNGKWKMEWRTPRKTKHEVTTSETPKNLPEILTISERDAGIIFWMTVSGIT
jgi:hypothetical protein